MPLSTITTTITAATTFCRLNIIYAKWRGRIANQPLQHDLPSYTDFYDVTICPELPLAVGREIKILALSTETSRAPPDLNHTTLPIQYDTYDPQVEGRIVGVRSVEGNLVEFVLENRIKNAAVSLAYVAVPYLPNVTAKLNILGRVIKWFTAKNQPNARVIHLESAVVRSVTEFSFSPCPARKTDLVTECSDEQSDGNPGTLGINTLSEEGCEEDVDSDATCNEDCDCEDKSECGSALSLY